MSTNHTRAIFDALDAISRERALTTPESMLLEQAQKRLLNDPIERRKLVKQR